MKTGLQHVGLGLTVKSILQKQRKFILFWFLLHNQLYTYDQWTSSCTSQHYWWHRTNPVWLLPPSQDFVSRLSYPFPLPSWFQTCSLSPMGFEAWWLEGPQSPWIGYALSLDGMADTEDRSVKVRCKVHINKVGHIESSYQKISQERQYELMIQVHVIQILVNDISSTP